jgi:3-hydroxyisobutyrate dehydrogenase-like beta-hydroxyacid dehydrogenase
MSVAILGLGIIGQAWYDNLAADGLDVRGWNRTFRARPGERSSPAEAARGAGTVIIVVADPPAVDSVLARTLPALGPGQLVVQCSTVDAACNRRCAERVTEAGALFLEAPFTGSKPAALARQTVFYAAGPAAALEAARPVLARLSKAILHVGEEVGAAASLKLALNLNVAAVAQGLCESLRFARASGISDEVYFQALRLNLSRSGLVDLKESKLRADDWSPQFSIRHMHKDLRLALGEAGDEPLAMLALLERIYAHGLERGWAEDDYISLMRLLGPPKQPVRGPGAEDGRTA